MKSPRWGLQAGALMVAVLAGILIGKSLNSGTGDEKNADGPNPQRPRLSERSADASNGAHERTTRHGGATLASKGNDRSQLERELQTILETPLRLQRTQKLLNFLDRLPDDQFADVYEQIKTSPGAALHNSERSMVLQAWAERDPIAATTHLQENGAIDWERETVLGTWATTDPEGAFAWAVSAEDAGDTNNWVVGALRGAASSDPQLARDLLERLDQGETRRNSLRQIQNFVTQFGYDYAEAWITGIGDDTLQKEASRRLADNLTNLDPAKAASWNMSIDDRDTRRDVSETVADRWARQDLEGAMAWVESLPEDTRTEAAEGIARQYARVDPAAGADWLAGMGDNPDLDGAKRVFIDEAFDKDPAISLTFVPNLANQQNQMRSYYRYLGTWMKQDPQEARSWTEANANALPERIVSRFMK